MFNKVISVQTLSNYMILVTFENGQNKEYDIKPMIEKFESFKALETTKGLFEQVRVDAGGYGISWNDDIDLEF